MTKGSKWGWLTCLEVLGGWAEDGGGAVREWVKEKQYRLGCRCGREVVVEAREFKGKRVQRNCGLEGCTYRTFGWELESTVEDSIGHGEGAASMRQASTGVGQASTPVPPQPAHTRLGRPPIYKVRGAVANYYLPPELSSWVKVYAEQKGTSASAVVARALAELRDRSVQNG